jgi:hypothetical protein
MEHPRVDRAAVRLTFLPFLDLLFAAIGIFLILIFQALQTGAEARLPGADLLLISRGAPALDWVEHGGDEVRQVPASGVPGLMRQQAERLGRGPRVVLAYSGDAIDQVRALTAALSAQRSVTAAGAPQAVPLVSHLPLDADGDAEARLLSRWLGPQELAHR